LADPARDSPDDIGVGEERQFALRIRLEHEPLVVDQGLLFGGSDRKRFQQFARPAFLSVLL
jgi:hypothetical protein